MKIMSYCLILLGFCNLAFADVQVRFEDATGSVNSMQSNGRKVRINGGPMPGYLLFDSASSEFFLVDPERKEVLRVAADEIGVMAEAGGLNVSLKPRGGGEKIAGYSTGRFDLIANGTLCGTVYGSTELMRNPEMKSMFAAMQGMHKISHSMLAGIRSLLTECQRANARLAQLTATSGFVLRIIDDNGRRAFEVTSLDTDATVDPGEYELPPGMAVVDWSEKLKATPQQVQQLKQQKQMDDMNKMMQQLQQSGGQMTPEMQQQLQKMMQQMQQMQQTQ